MMAKQPRGASVASPADINPQLQTSGNSSRILVMDVGDVHEKSIGDRSMSAFKREIATKPRVVYVRFKVFDIKAIDGANGIVLLDFAVYLRWFDQSCINVSRETFGRTAEEYEQLWHPRVEINNDQGLSEIWDPDTSWNLKDYETGEVKYSQRYRGPVSNSMDLRNFPFDSDVLTIHLGPKFYKEDKLIFESDPDHKVEETSVSHALEEWTVSTPVSVDFITGKFGHRNVDLNIIVHRNSGYYIWKVLLINLLAGMFSWTVFLTPASEFIDRINSTLTLFLAEVAFLFVIADKLPQVSYLTVMDRIVLGSFVLLFATAIESVLAYTFISDGKFFSSAGGPDYVKAEEVDKYAFFLFPLAFFLLHVVCIFRAISKRSLLKKLGVEAKDKLI